MHDHRLAGLGGRHDEAALALANRCHQVDYAGGEVVWRGLQAQAILWVQGRELGELRAVARRVRIVAVDRVELDERRELLASLSLAGLTGHARHGIALAQTLLAHH